MQTVKDLAIVLKCIPFEEKHRIVTALTEHSGMITVIARNSIQSRRFGSTLEHFTASEWIFTLKPHSTLHTLKETTFRKDFPLLQNDFQKLALAGTFTELILKLSPQNEESTELFKLYSNALMAANEAGSDSYISLLNSFLIKILQWSGHQPSLSYCLSCQKKLDDLDQKEEITCIVPQASWVCETCRAQKTKHIEATPQFKNSYFKMKRREINRLRIYCDTPIRKTPLQLDTEKNLFHFLESLLIFHLPQFDQKPIKSLRFLGIESNLQHPGSNP